MPVSDKGLVSPTLTVTSTSRCSPEPAKGKRAAERRHWCRENLLLVLTMAAVLGGVVAGALLRLSSPSSETIRLVGFPGELFMNMLKMLIVPLIVAALISGLAQLDARQSGKVGTRALFYYSLTTTMAVAMGIVLVLLIHPGDPSIKAKMATDEGRLLEKRAEISAGEKMLDLLRNMFPDNIVRATFQLQESKFEQIGNGTERQRHVGYADGMNVLGLIVFCITAGVVMSRLGDRARAVIDFFVALDRIVTRMVGVYMWFGPIGIASLIAAKMLEISDLAATAQALGMFMLTVILGLALQAFITLPAIYFFAARNNPFHFLRGLSQAVLTALGTASSAATLPITFRCLDDLGIDERITKFVLPVGATINMDGTALYEAVASVFIAQVNGMDLSMGQVLTVSVTATLASIGAASIPSAGLVTMLIVLSALGLPASDVTLVLVVDWFLDRLRTSVNVIGDAFGCGFVHYLCIDDLPPREPKSEPPAKENPALDLSEISLARECCKPTQLKHQQITIPIDRLPAPP